MANQAKGVFIFTVLVSLAVTINYADRSIISTTIIYMAEEFKWNESTQGTVLTGFFIGYAITQSFGGFLSDRFDSKFIISCSFTIWCLFTILTPFTASHDGIAGMMIIRILVGLAEGLLFPAIHSTISRCIPYTYRSTVVSVMTSASYFGVTAAFFSAPFIASSYGWRDVFYIIGAAGIPWLPLWAYYDADNLTFLYRPKIFNNKPKKINNSNINAKETNIIGAPTIDLQSMESNNDKIHNEASSALNNELSSLNNTDPPFTGGYNNENSYDNLNTSDKQSSDTVEFPAQKQYVSHNKNSIKPLLYSHLNFWQVFKKLIARTEVWAILIGQYANSFGILGLVSWLPTFMKQQYDVTPEKLSIYTSIPYIGQTIFGFAAGFIADYFIYKGYRVLYVRNFLQTTAMIFPALFLFCMVFFDVGEVLAVVFLFIGCSASALSCASISVNQLDICPEFAGFIFGMGSASGVIAAIVAVPLLGFVIQLTDSWLYVFSIFSVHYLIGNFFWLLWASDKPMVLS